MAVLCRKREKMSAASLMDATSIGITLLTFPQPSVL